MMTHFYYGQAALYPASLDKQTRPTRETIIKVWCQLRIVSECVVPHPPLD